MNYRRSTIVRKRINLSLPEETVALIDRINKLGDLNSLIDVAIRHYVSSIERAKLKARIKAGAQKRGERDLQLAAEWFNISTQTQ